MSAPKPSAAPEDILYDEMDEANKLSYYKAVEKELKEAKEREGLPEHLTEEEMAVYVESFRSFYYTNEILGNNKAGEFFEDVIRELHPTAKLKAPTKNMIKICSKIFVQELAETCFEIGSLTNRPEVDCDLVTDAFQLMQKRRTKKNNVGQLFNQLHY